MQTEKFLFKGSELSLGYSFTHRYYFSTSSSRVTSSAKGRVANAEQLFQAVRYRLIKKAATRAGERELVRIIEIEQGMILEREEDGVCGEQRRLTLTLSGLALYR